MQDYYILYGTLASNANEACLTIYSSFSRDEVVKLPKSIQDAWNVGKEAQALTNRGRENE